MIKLFLDKDNLPSNMMVWKPCKKCGNDIRYTSKERRCVACQAAKNDQRQANKRRKVRFDRTRFTGE